MNYIVAYCHSAKLCAHAAQAFPIATLYRGAECCVFAKMPFPQNNHRDMGQLFVWWVLLSKQTLLGYTNHLKENVWKHSRCFVQHRQLH